MLITTKLNIDMQRNVQRHVVNVVQNDTNTRAVEFRLFSDCGRWIVPDGVTAALSYSKPDGTSGIYDKLPDGADAFTITGEAVTVILAPQMLTVPGEVRVALVLTESNSDQLSTFPFVVNVAESPNPGKIVSENYCYHTNLDAINAAINELKQAVGGNGGGTGAGSGSDSGQNPTGGGLTTAQINALDGMFNVVAFTKDDISAVYSAFREAFGLKALSSISATYSGGNVTVGTAVSALTGIVVTAHYSDGSTETVTGYSLSGKITEGNNTITVGYGGMTTTFTVIGVYEAGTFTITNTLTNVTTNNAAKTITEGEPYTATLTAKGGYELTAVTVTMDGEDITETAYSGGVVSISSVTGNVVIIASAAEKAAEIFEPESNTAVSVTLDQANTLLDPNTGTTSSNVSWVASDYAAIPVGYDYVVFQCDKSSNIRYALYDSEKKFIRGSTMSGVTATVQEVGAENAAYIRLSNNKTVETVTLVFGKNMVTSWGTTTDNKMNSDGTITEGYTGPVQQRISNGYVRIPDGVTHLFRMNRAGYIFRYVDIAIYDENFASVEFDSADNLHSSKIVALSDVINAVYFKAAAWDAGKPDTNNNPAEQIIFGYY